MHLLPVFDRDFGMPRFLLLSFGMTTEGTAGNPDFRIRFFSGLANMETLYTHFLCIFHCHIRILPFFLAENFSEKDEITTVKKKKLNFLNISDELKMSFCFY